MATRLQHAPRCLQCDDGRPRYPSGSARFCTRSCAAEYAIDESCPYRWCRNCGAWRNLVEIGLACEPICSSCDTMLPGAT